MTPGDIAGIAEARRVIRAVVHDVAATVTAGGAGRALDGPEKTLLWLPWPPDLRIILKGSLGFLRQVLRFRTPGLRRHA